MGTLGAENAHVVRAAIVEKRDILKSVATAERPSSLEPLVKELEWIRGGKRNSLTGASSHTSSNPTLSIRLTLQRDYGISNTGARLDPCRKRDTKINPSQASLGKGSQRKGRVDQRKGGSRPWS